MLFVVAGVPGQLVEWCQAVTQRLAEAALGAVRVLEADSLEAVAVAAIGAGSIDAIVATRQPGRKLLSALAAAGRPFLMAADDPRLALAELVLRQGVDLAAAIQAIASSCGALMGAESLPGTLVLRARPAAAEAIASAATVAAHLGLPVDDAALPELLGNLAAGPEAGPSADEIGAWWRDLSSPEQQMITGALAPFVAPPLVDALSISWHRDLFFVADRPQERARQPIDITGRPRCLLEGPHIVLPPGAWSLNLTLDLSPEAADYDYLVEVSAERVLASGVLSRDAQASGLALAFTIDDLVDRPLSIRVSTTRAAFDGVVSIGEARLLRTSVTGRS